MDESFRKQTDEWFQRGLHDIETAQLLYDAQGHADSIAYHIQQAIEKYLKGYMVYHGEKPPKIHELDALLNRVLDFDNGLLSYLDLCEKVSRYYIEARYPPGPIAEYKYDEIKHDLDNAWKLIKRIRASVEI